MLNRCLEFVMRISFAQCSYRAQVARLRKLAHNALAQFDVDVYSLKLIAHWNNTTFDVCDAEGHWEQYFNCVVNSILKIVSINI
mgnify:CR=1 FL=1